MSVQLTIKQKYILLAVLVLLGFVVSALSVMLLLNRPAKGEYFKGTITKELIDCTVADSGSIIYVDVKKVFLDPGNVMHRGDVGNASALLTVCDSYNYTGNSNLLNYHTDSNGGEEMVGRSVEVYAAKTKDGYTLLGNKEFYVR